jgi:hypothetical protein
MNPYMMNNPYLGNMISNPYSGTAINYGQDMNMQPTFQNTSAQSAMQNAAMQEQNNQVQQAGMIGQQGGNAQQQALAMALRNRNNDPYAQTARLNKQYGAENVFSKTGGGGTVPNYVANSDLG